MTTQDPVAVEQCDERAAKNLLANIMGEEVRYAARLRIATRALARHRQQACADLEHKLKSVISHATGGNMTDIDLPLNTISCEITRLRNFVFQAGKDSARADLDAENARLTSTPD